MARTAADYLRLLQSLLPTGKLWNKDSNSVLTQFLYGEAEEFARVDARSDQLIIEKDTRTTSELLTDHEIDFGIPDDCFSLDTTDRLRRNAIHTKLLKTGRQDKQYFIDIAASLGYTIEITEYTPLWCGLGLAGDECGGWKVFSYWKVSIEWPDVEAGPYAKGFGISFDTMYSADIETLYCIIRSLKPGHSTVIFDFIGPDYDEAFAFGFDSLPSDLLYYLEGAYGFGFSIAFDINHGGEFDFDMFGNGFEKSH